MDSFLKKQNQLCMLKIMNFINYQSAISKTSKKMKMKFIENQYLISHHRFYNFLYTFVDGKICPNNLSFAIAFMVLAKMKSNQNFVEIEHIPIANVNSKPTSEE